MNLAPHEQRVLEEHQDLSIKLEKLHLFLSTPLFLNLTEAEQTRLHSQAMFMEGYKNILEQRINVFT